MKSGSEEEHVSPGIVNWKAEMLQNVYKIFGECLLLSQNPNKNLEGEYLESSWDALTEKSGELPIPADCLVQCWKMMKSKAQLICLLMLR